MLKYLFSSKARVDVLKLLLFNPAGNFYQKQISERTGQPIMAVQREVAKLESIGLIIRSTSGNRVYYGINRQSQIFEELKNIFLKCAGIAETLRENFSKSKYIDVAFIYGSYAKGKEQSESDIDLFIIGAISSKEISRLLSKTKQQLGREINFTVMPGREFAERVKSKNHFINSLISDKKIYLIGDENELKTIAGSE